MKRKLFATLTSRAFVCWADFLDLQAQGPVPWKSEIGVAIQECSKFLAILDKEYLLSFNCLEELAYAIHHSKPLVLAILDQEAWNMLTTVGGYTKVWRTQPGGDAPPLSSYDGQAFGPTGKAFEAGDVKQIFTILSAINFCPCRPLDVANMGAEEVASRFVDFASKDLDYAKEHSFLLSRATAWEAADRPSGLLIERQSDVQRWTEWVAVAIKASAVPVPTEVQKEYVLSSSIAYQKRALTRTRCRIAAVVVIVILALAAVALAGVFFYQMNEAHAQRTEANLQRYTSAALLLSSKTEPERTSGIRAVSRAVDIAHELGAAYLTAPALQATLMYLTNLTYWFWDIDGHQDNVNAVSFSPHGHHVASASGDGTVRITPLTERVFGNVSVVPIQEPSVSLQCTTWIQSMSWSPDGTFIAAGCIENSKFPEAVPIVRVWHRTLSSDVGWRQLYDLQTREQGDVWALTWSPDSQLLLAGDEEGQVALWNISRSAQSYEAPGHILLDFGDVRPGRIRGTAWSPAKNAMAVSDRNLYLWHLDGTSLSSLHHVLYAQSTTAHTDDINVLSFSPDGRWLASGSDDRYSMIFAVPNISEAGLRPTELKLVYRLARFGDSVTGLSWSTRRELAICSEDSTGLCASIRSDVVLGHGRTSMTVLALSHGWTETNLGWAEGSLCRKEVVDRGWWYLLCVCVCVCVCVSAGGVGHAPPEPSLVAPRQLTTICLPPYQSEYTSSRAMGQPVSESSCSRN